MYSSSEIASHRALPESSCFIIQGKSLTGTCNYCHNGENRKCVWRMQIRSLLCKDYQYLMDLGWRRCGFVIYKFIMNQTCCPAYTIRVNANKFLLSRHQRKLLQRVIYYLQTNQLQRANQGQKISKESIAFNQIKNSNVPERPSSSDSSADSFICASSHTSKQKTAIINPNKSRAKRWDRKLQHFRTLATKSGIPFEQLVAEHGKRREQRLLKHQGKSLGWYMEQILSVKASNSYSPRLTVNLVRVYHFSSDPATEALLQEEHQVYQLYQTHVHGDTMADCGWEQFIRFLVRTPLQGESADLSDTGPTFSGDSSLTSQDIPALGSYHQVYRLDGRIIAVGVVDLLATSWSSVYFFYHPQFEFLNLGTLSALQEIWWVQQSHRQQFYYMGLYIHTCPKMRYKAAFKPSQLLCPETFLWVPLEKALPLLDTQPYQRLSRRTHFSGQHNILPREPESPEQKLALVQQHMRFVDRVGGPRVHVKIKDMDMMWEFATNIGWYGVKYFDFLIK